LLKEFIKKNHKKVGITDKLRARIERHAAITNSLLTHYKVEIEMSLPIIEYSRYVLDKGTFNEMFGLAEGITVTVYLLNRALVLERPIN